MNRFANQLKLAAVAITLAVLATSPAIAGDVSITLSGVKSAQGDLYVALQTAEDFMQPRGSYGQIIKLPADGDQKIVLKDVKAGDYAVQVWHDVNNDHQFNVAANGMPLDGWAMINAEKLRAKPTFDQVKLSVPANGSSVSLPMHYAK